MAESNGLVADAMCKIEELHTCQANKDLIKGFSHYLISTNRQKFAMLRHIESLRTFFEFLDDDKVELKDLTKERMQEVVVKLPIKIGLLDFNNISSGIHSTSL